MLSTFWSDNQQLVIFPFFNYLALIELHFPIIVSEDCYCFTRSVLLAALSLINPLLPSSCMNTLSSSSLKTDSIKFHSVADTLSSYSVFFVFLLDVSS